MTEAGIAPSGLPDTAQDSQLLAAVKAVTSGALRPSVIEALRRSYAEAGYKLVNGSFEAGGTLVNANDVLLQESTGKAFSGPVGTVVAGTNPASGGFVDRSIPRNGFHSYNGLDDIGINIATLSAGSAISTIVAGMSDGTSLSFSFSNEAWVSNDIGFQFGVCTVIRTNGFIAYAIAVESSSSITANITPRAAIISVFRTTQSGPKLIVGESNTLSVGYTGPGSPAVAGPITISNASLVNNMMFHVSDSASGSSFVSKFSRAEINGYISRSASVTLKSNLSGTIVMTFTAGGVNISSVSGTPYLRYVFTN